MKKLTIFLVMSIFAFGLFAIDMSVGGGFAVSPSFYTFSQTFMGTTMKGSMQQGNVNVYGFFDATYVEASVGLLFGFPSQKIKASIEGASEKDTEKGFSSMGLSIAAMGKYPIALGKVIISPMAGIEYNLNLSYKKDGKDVKEFMDDDEKTILNDLWFKLGASADFAITESLFVRPVALFAIGAKKKAFDDFDSQFHYKFDIGCSLGFKL
ncbi:MAG TPA: hypothetical protein VLZ44_00500 [Treponemataceae bacterium]|nr:hypothetical protein [Treponemataceae bacterium]